MNQTFQVDHFRPLNAGHKDLFEFNGIAKVLQKNSFEEVLYFVQVNYPYYYMQIHNWMVLTGTLTH